jgi:uncharacterized integral membrane protein
MQFYFVVALIFAVLVAIFAIQNSTPVDVEFLFWEVKNISQVLVILGASAIGALIVLFMGAGKQIKLIWQVRQLTQQNNQLQKESEELKQKLQISQDKEEKELEKTGDTPPPEEAKPEENR